MKRFTYFVLAGIIVSPAGAFAQSAAPSQSLQSALKAELTKYLHQHGKTEHISTASLSVSLPDGAPNINVAAGTMQFGAGAPVTATNLFQIGSVTKSFTSVAILHLEAAGKLDIEETVGRWLPQYPAYRDVTIRQLLNMTSDIPTYDDMRSMLSEYAAHPRRDWSPSELVAFVYPKLDRTAPWLYSNTAYLMSQMIIEKATGQSYTSVVEGLFADSHLTNTYYDPHVSPPPVLARTVSGYFFSKDPDNAGLAPLYGKDMRDLSLSWAQAAGAIVSTPEDVTHWARALYEGPLLAPKQRAELMTVVSQKTGKPIDQTSVSDPHGFGLGVGELFVPSMGRAWFYEGMTLGYRMTYAYLPESHVTYAVGLNSQPPKKEDHVGQLMQAIFKQLKAAGKI